MNSLKQQLCLEITLKACEQAASFLIQRQQLQRSLLIVSKKIPPSEDASFQFLWDAVTVSLQNETEKQSFCLLTSAGEKQNQGDSLDQIRKSVVKVIHVSALKFAMAMISG